MLPASFMRREALGVGLVEEVLDLAPVVAPFASRGAEIGQETRGGPACNRAGMYFEDLRNRSAGQYLRAGDPEHHGSYGTSRSDTYRYGSLMSASLQARYLDRVDAPEIDYRAELPPHRQIAAWLLECIQSGELVAGKPVPSEKELMDLFGVARTTVRRAIAYLRDQAAIRTVPGRGSYVVKRGS
jgi:GntR family transcriptional regulator